jgi:hypothetical protein
MRIFAITVGCCAPSPAADLRVFIARRLPDDPLRPVNASRCDFIPCGPRRPAGQRHGEGKWARRHSKALRSLATFRNSCPPAEEDRQDDWSLVAELSPGSRARTPHPILCRPLAPAGFIAIFAIAFRFNSVANRRDNQVFASDASFYKTISINLPAELPLAARNVRVSGVARPRENRYGQPDEKGPLAAEAKVGRRARVRRGPGMKRLQVGESASMALEEAVAVSRTSGRQDSDFRGCGEGAGE